MSYEEFWEMDHLIVESYVKKHEMDIERETASNWELVTYIRAAILEVATAMANDPKKGNKPLEFPTSPLPRTVMGRRKEERNKKITEERNFRMNQRRENRRKAKSDDND